MGNCKVTNLGHSSFCLFEIYCVLLGFVLVWIIFEFGDIYSFGYLKFTTYFQGLYFCESSSFSTIYIKSSKRINLKSTYLIVYLCFGHKLCRQRIERARVLGAFPTCGGVLPTWGSSLLIWGGALLGALPTWGGCNELNLRNRGALTTKPGGATLAATAVASACSWASCRSWARDYISMFKEESSLLGRHLTHGWRHHPFHLHGLLKDQW